MDKLSYTEEFKNFLSEEEIYFQNKKFWKSNIKEFTEEDIEEWILNEFGNGKAINDGNPIFSCRIGNDRAIRIIQAERDKITPIFASWNTENKVGDTTIDELVIAVQPYKKIYDVAIELIDKFLKNKYKRFQHQQNIYFNKVTNERRITYLVDFFENTGLEENSWNLEKKQIKEGDYKISHFKKINNVSYTLSFFPSKFENREIAKAYYSTLKSLWQLNEAITLKNSLDIRNISSKRKYKGKIIEKYINIHNFYISYNSKVDNLEDKYKDLKESLEKYST